MADSTTTPETEDTTRQTAPMEPSGSEPKTFTQEQVNRMMQERIARVKAEPPADYEELKAKAARFDEIEEANKSELERANDAKARAEAEAADWKAKFEREQEERERMASVNAMSAQYGVDASVLSRMTGDVEENAKLLAGVISAQPKFGSVSDNGEQNAPAETLEEALKHAKSTAERINIREEFNARNRNR